MRPQRPLNVPAWLKVVLDFLAKIVAAAIVQVIKDWLR